MADLGIMYYEGVSGTRYKFTVSAWGTPFNPLGAVYIVTDRVQNQQGGYTHEVIYVGQTGDLSERFDNHHKVQCFNQNNRNCICTHLDANEASRLRKEADLIARYDPPCND